MYYYEWDGLDKPSHWNDSPISMSPGAGKSTLLKLLLDEYGPHFGFSVSHTTRSPRPGEEHGKHYYFVSRQEMERAIGAGEFIENAVFSGWLKRESFFDFLHDFLGLNW